MLCKDLPNRKSRRHRRFFSAPLKKCAFVVIVIALMSSSTHLSAQDYGILDTVSTLPPSLRVATCQPSLTVEIPVYLFTAGYYEDCSFQFHWTGNAVCDSIVSQGVWKQFAQYEVYSTDNDLKESDFIISAFPGIYPSTQGIVAKIHMTCSLGDTISLIFPFNDFRLQSLLGPWVPRTQWLDRQILIPDTLALPSGDSNCSGYVTISDAVYLIQYIFSGGLAPYDHNAADPDASCQVTISDVVYLINYIFSGGTAPQAGCVVP